jgi:hypothetical protein
MICGPAFIVMAKGMTARFMISPLGVRLPWAADYSPHVSSSIPQ